MTNKKNLLLVITALSFAAPLPARADVIWDLFTFLFGGGGSNVASKAIYNNYQSCAETTRGYTCDPNPRPRQTPIQIAAGREAMRAATLEPVDERRGCSRYANGCVDCPGPQHPMNFKSPGGRNIMLSKPGQNHLTLSVRQVLMKLADTRDKDVSVTSGYRSCNYQKRTRQGVPRSQHLKGNAADFIFVGAGPTHGALAEYARKTLSSMGRQGGTGTYCSAPAHVDTGNQRQWNWCRRGGRKQ